MQTTEAQEELYCGADLHGNNGFLVLCDGQGQRVMQRRVKANGNAVNAALAPYGERVRTLAVESTYNWYWLVDGLRGQGREGRADCGVAGTARLKPDGPACRQTGD